MGGGGGGVESETSIRQLSSGVISTGKSICVPWGMEISRECALEASWGLANSDWVLREVRENSHQMGLGKRRRWQWVRGWNMPSLSLPSLTP